MEPNRPGNSGRYLRVLNCASEYGLSLEQCGREWLLVTPKSASSRATGLEAMDVPPSAAMGGWAAATFCLRYLLPWHCPVCPSCSALAGIPPGHEPLEI